MTTLVPKNGKFIAVNTREETEDEFIEALIDLVRKGDIGWADGVRMFRDEYQCGMDYVLRIGLTAQLQRLDKAWLKKCNEMINSGVTK